MSTSFYVSPEQLVKDRVEFARKGIARGRSVVVGSCADGVVLVAENPSTSLHKISEIYDRIAFAAVGKYHEFESLRVAGIRYADGRGYAYAREDVTARALANAYSQSLGVAFTAGPKPYEVELVVAEVGATAAEDSLFRLRFDGSVGDEEGFVAMGGDGEALSATLRHSWDVGMSCAHAVRQAAAALLPRGDAAERSSQLEVAVLERGCARRSFRRVPVARVQEWLRSCDGAGESGGVLEGQA
ncbi:Proteasome subunit alpha [Dermatophilus congolensis]|uniref:Proteasome subunit alpha n=1 Tax=Dermatophilus congolensis TaxID=1863 RepID=A0AA46BN40_9MICO|nr:proteasome subunit alpha [Dermatophilus congolensis]STD08760.1 Proteasome subunit alpha [Dermatophilus congolensis]